MRMELVISLLKEKGPMSIDELTSKLVGDEVTSYYRGRQRNCICAKLRTLEKQGYAERVTSDRINPVWTLTEDGMGIRCSC